MIVIGRCPHSLNVGAAPFRLIWQTFDCPCKLNRFALKTMEDVLASGGTNSQENTMVPLVIIAQWLLRSSLVAATLTKTNEPTVKWSKTYSLMGRLPIITPGPIPKYGRSVGRQPSHDGMSRRNLLPNSPLETKLQRSQPAFHQFDCILDGSVCLTVIRW